MSTDFKGCKVLVVGGAGFIGSHTVDALIEKGADVVIVDNLSTGKKENLNANAKFYNLNIADPEIEEVMEKERPDIIYNFAFFVLVPKSLENPLLDLDCLQGMLRILKKAKKLGVKKFVYASSGFLYGNTPNLPVTETEPFEYVTPYTVAKVAAENYLNFYKKTFDLPYVVVRYAAIYGPRQVTGAMADYIRKLAAGEQAEMWGDGNKTRDYVFVKDVVRANLMAVEVAENHTDPVFNIGTGLETTLNALYSQIADILDKDPKPIYYPDRAGEQMRYCLNASKVKDSIGWEPQYSLEEGLRETLRSWGHI